VTLRFRGRELAHQEFGVRLLERVRNDLEPYGVVEQFPKMEGRQLVMVLSPKKGAKPVPAQRPPAKAAASAAPAMTGSPQRAGTPQRADAAAGAAKK
jgi:translation initiation factor IF-3